MNLTRWNNTLIRWNNTYIVCSTTIILYNYERKIKKGTAQDLKSK